MEKPVEEKSKPPKNGDGKKKKEKSKKKEKKEGKLQHKEVQNALSVARTNDDSSVSKRSAARAKYIDDAFLTHFVKKPSKRSALINRGYYIRRYAVLHVVTAFIEKHGGKCQVVSLGAGFDSLYFVIPKDKRCTHHYEVDFDHVVKRKAEVIRHTEQLKEELGDFIFNEAKEVIGSNYSLLAGDLCQFDSFKTRLLKGGIDVSMPTLVLAECVFTYMTNSNSDRVIEWVANEFASPWFVTYEQIRPYDAFGRTMRENLVARGSDLLGIEGYPTQHQQMERYRKLGYKEVCVRTMLEIYDGIEGEEKNRIELLEEFDEIEEWREKCSHYTVAISSLKEGEELPFFSRGKNAKKMEVLELSKEWKEEAISPTQRHADGRRWGHSVCALNDGRLVVFGGYGGSARHERVNSVLVVDVLNNHSYTPANVCGGAPSARVLHSSCMIKDNTMLMYGGRSNPSNAMNDLYLLQCDSYEWQKLDIITPDVPARYRHSMNRIPNTSKVVIFGGKEHWKESECNDMLVIDVENRSWNRVESSSAESMSGRISHSALWFNDSLYIYGGFNKAEGVLSDLWKIHLSSDYCSYKAEKLNTNLPGRFSHAGVVFQSQMLFFGGCDLSHENAIVALNPVTLKSTVMKSKNEMYSRPRAVVVSNRVYLVGGGMLCFSFGSIFAEQLLAFTFGGEFIAPHREEKEVEIPKQPSKLVGDGEIRKKEINRITNASKEQFFEYVMKIREPCIFENCKDVPKWNKEDILSSVPKSTLASVHVCDSPLLDFSNKNFVFKVIPFDEMLEKMEDPDSFMYFRSLGPNARKDPSNMKESFPKLAEQFLVPELCKDIVTDEAIHSSCLRFSSADIQMWTHYDINDNVLVGLKGTKRLMLFHPEEVRHLYAEGTASSVIDVDNPDWNKFPKFAKAVQWIGTLNEGDVLFIPAMWWHNVRTLSPCYGVNVFFRQLAPNQYQPNDLYGNKDPVSAVNAQKSLQKALESLNELPKDYKNFFAQKMILELKKNINSK